LVLVAGLGTGLSTGRDEETPRRIAVTDSALPGADPLGAKPSARRARLVVKSQTGLAGGPLPLGTSVNDGSGGESLMLTGLAPGTKLSVGTPIGGWHWLVPAADLDQLVVRAPNDFIGVMNAVIDLQAANGEHLDSQLVRLEWTQKKSEHSPE